MGIASHLFWLSCAFGSAALAAIPARTSVPALLAAAAGFAAGATWVESLQLEGALSAVAYVLAATPAVVSAYFTARRPSFAPPVVRDEALLLALAFGLASAMFPGLSEGWRSAAALNAGEAAAASTVPAWILGLVGTLLGAGGLYTWWRRA